MQEIAGKLTICDWEELASKLDNSKPENWGNAFNFFEQRMTTRYLNPINKILKMGLNAGEGFAAVNLQCSLIETIESFYSGCIFDADTRQFKNIEGNKIFDNNKKIFESFFQKREPFKSLKIDGADFYKSVRCGLLHETQTKNNWKIKSGRKKIFENVNDEKIIYRERFQLGIEEVIIKYKEELLSSRGEKYRKIFKEKFKHICDQSKVK